MHDHRPVAALFAGGRAYVVLMADCYARGRRSLGQQTLILAFKTIGDVFHAL